MAELIDHAVRKHLRVDLQDMEEIRRSPGASIFRIESRLDSIEALLDRDMVTRSEFQESFGRVNARLSTVETALEAAVKAMLTRAEFHETMGQVNARLAKLEATTITRVEFKEEMAAQRAEFKEEMAALRAESKGETVSLRAEIKDEIWKLKLYFILLAALMVLTNPKVLELFGKVWDIFK